MAIRKKSRIEGVAPVEILAVAFKEGREHQLVRRIAMRIGGPEGDGEVVLFPSKLGSAGFAMPQGGLKRDILTQFDKANGRVSKEKSDDGEQL